MAVLTHEGMQGCKTGDVHDFEPVSDFEFAELRAALLAEYHESTLANCTSKVSSRCPHQAAPVAFFRGCMAERYPVAFQQ